MGYFCFLCVCVFVQEEEGKTVMGKDRRKDGIRTKLQRLEECITKTKSDREGLDLVGSGGSWDFFLGLTIQRGC